MSEENIKATELEKEIEKLQQNVVEVRVSCCKGKCRTSIPPEFLGIKATTGDTKDFVKDYFDSGSFLFFPKRVFTDADGKARRTTRKIERLALAKGLNGFYINCKDYATVKEDYNKRLSEFNEIKSDLIKQHASYLNLFKNQTQKFLEEQSVPNSDKILEVLVSKFPTAEMIEKSFNLELIVQTYPLITSSFNCSDVNLSSDLMKSHEAKAIETFHNIEATMLSGAYQRVLNLMDKLDTGDPVAGKTLDSVKKFILRMQRDNEIVKSKNINFLVEVLKRVVVDHGALGRLWQFGDDPISQEENLQDLEIILGYIYECAKAIGREDCLVLDNIYSLSELEDIATFTPLEKLFIRKKD